MYEQNTSAFVLGRENVSEYDSLVVLYTKDLGKVLARVTSGGKISSKLTPHLQVGNKVAVRLVERKIMRVADALSFPLNLLICCLKIQTQFIIINCVRIFITIYFIRLFILTITTHKKHQHQSRYR